MESQTDIVHVDNLKTLQKLCHMILQLIPDNPECQSNQCL